jgi:hypothetical protein
MSATGRVGSSSRLFSTFSLMFRLSNVVRA